MSPESQTEKPVWIDELGYVQPSFEEKSAAEHDKVSSHNAGVSSESMVSKLAGFKTAELNFKDFIRPDR